jgi:TPR repeat protein
MEGASDEDLKRWFQNVVNGLEAEQERLQDLASWKRLLNAATFEDNGVAACYVGQVYMRIGDAGTARTWFIRAARKDIVDAVEQMAWFSDQPPCDEAEIFHYALQSVRLAVVGSEYRLALCFSRGIGVKKDGDQAMRLMKKAVNYEHQHLGVSLLELGKWYNDGTWVDVDIDLALSLWKRSAALNNVDAMFNLGRHFWIIENDEVAVFWFEKAALLGDEEAMRYLKDKRCLSVMKSKLEKGCRRCEFCGECAIYGLPTFSDEDLELLASHEGECRLNEHPNLRQNK